MILMTQNKELLIVEDDPILGRNISAGLTEHGYTCTLVTSGAEAAQLAAENQYRVVLIDLALEDESALGVLRCIRESNDNASIVMLSPLEFRSERLMGIEAGADDFVIKPFVMREVLARVEVAIIRSGTRPKSQLDIGPLSMDLSARKVSRERTTINLTPTEFRILEILMRNQGKVVTRRMLCEFLWNPEWEGVTNVIEVHINRLRTKIERPNGPQLIHTIRGSGYSLRWAAPEPNGHTSTAGVSESAE